MKKLKSVLNDVRQVIKNNANKSSLWIQSSKKDDDGVWSNDNATISDILNCEDDNMFFNLWMKLEKGSAEELSSFIEEHLVPNNLRILEDTENLSKDGNSVRFMIARPLNN